MIEPRTPVSVTMPAERWDQVLRVMSEASLPHRVTDPLIREIHQQCMAADIEPQEHMPMRARPNGEEQPDA